MTHWHNYINVFSMIYFFIVSFMQSVNKAQFSNITFLFLLIWAAAVPVFITVKVLFAKVIKRHYNHLNLILSLKF